VIAVLLLHDAAHAAAWPLEKGRVVIDGRVTIDVEVARSPQAQAKGLAGRVFLKKGTGMIFPYEAPGRRAFWMKGMLIPIDIIWIRRGTIVAIDANLPPPFSTGALDVYSRAADLVLEVPAGYAEEMGIRVGHQVTVTYQ
jgi:uncharacterized membrane protein (UPF0127 family)